MGVWGLRMEERLEREGQKDSDEDEEKGIGDWGARLSEVMVMGRQKREESLVKVVKASWSSGETV